jgi:hypothetical protein
MTISLRSFRLAILLALCLLFALLACSGPERSKETGSETHFLHDCALGCGTLDCWCGICTRSCNSDASCTTLSDIATCVAPANRGDQTCSAMEMTSICDVPCATDDECTALGVEFSCTSGHCRRPVEALCERSEPTGAGVVLIGDVMLELTPFDVHLTTFARASGAYAADATFRNHAAAAESFLASGSLAIENQYARAKAESPATLVIMTGGETDVLQEPCGATPTADCAEFRAAVSGLEALLVAMAADGVRDVVYVFYADPVERPSVLAGLDVLRPLAESACATAPLPCHFVDLRPVFEGRYEEYVGIDGLVWSEAGAQAAASAVWDLMQSQCLE